MQLILWMLSISLVSVVGTAQADKYEWTDKQHVCAIDAARYVHTDGSSMGPWLGPSGSFFVNVQECRNIAAELQTNNSDDPCYPARDESYIASTLQKEYALSITGAKEINDLWKPRSWIGFAVPEGESTMISSWGTATAYLSTDGLFRYMDLDKTTADDKPGPWAWWAIEAKCAPVVVPN